MEELVLLAIIVTCVVVVLVIVMVAVKRKRRQKHVMISYAHVDHDFTFELRDKLLAAGFRVWIDTNITPAEDWRANIATAIEQAGAVVFVMSPASVASRYCKEELFYAGNCNVTLFPVVYKDSIKELSGGAKLVLQRLQWIFMDSDDAWTHKMDCLVEQLRSHMEGKDDNEHTNQTNQTNAAKQMKRSKRSSKKKKEDEKKKAVLDLLAQQGPTRPHHEPSEALKNRLARVQKSDCYICYDTSNLSEGIVYAAFAYKLADLLQSVGFTVSISSRRDIRDMNEIVTLLKRESQYKSNAVVKTDPKEAAAAFVKGAFRSTKVASSSPMHCTTDRESLIKSKASKKTLLPVLHTKPAPAQPAQPEVAPAPRVKFMPHLDKREHAEALLRRPPNAEQLDLDGVFDLNVKQMEMSSMMIFLCSPDALQGDLVDELHCAGAGKEIVVVKCHAAAIKPSKQAQAKMLVGSVGVVLQDRCNVQMGKCQRHLGWESAAAAPQCHRRYDICAIEIILAALKSKKEQLLRESRKEDVQVKWRAAARTTKHGKFAHFYVPIFVRKTKGKVRPKPQSRTGHERSPDSPEGSMTDGSAEFPEKESVQ